MYFLMFFSGFCLGDNTVIKAVDYGENISVPCFPESSGNGEDEADDGWLNHEAPMWVREGREDEQIPRMSVQHDGSLSLSNLGRDDSGLYVCQVEDEVRMRVKLEVRGTSWFSYG